MYKSVLSRESEVVTDTFRNEYFAVLVEARQNDVHEAERVGVVRGSAGNVAEVGERNEGLDHLWRDMTDDSWDIHLSDAHINSKPRLTHGNDEHSLSLALWNRLLSTA